MRYILFEKQGVWDTKSVLQQVVNTNPRGMLLDEMRRRIAILDLLEAAKVHLLLEDRDHTFVCDALRNFAWGVAHRDLMAVIDHVLEAGEAPAILLPKAEVAAAPMNGAGGAVQSTGAGASATPAEKSAP